MDNGRDKVICSFYLFNKFYLMVRLVIEYIVGINEVVDLINYFWLKGFMVYRKVVKLKV